MSLLTKREIYFMLSTDIFKISLYVRDDKLVIAYFLRINIFQHYSIQN